MTSCAARSLLRLAVALALGLLAAACASTHPSLEPLPPKAMADLAAKGLKVGAPIHVRVFKEENELEVWLGHPDGHYVPFRTYKVCQRSGGLGPKLAEGDRQAPEGFYQVSQRQMNPNSAYHLSFNLGFPNAYDSAHGRTGSLLMIHGGCKSVGCYAITDASIQELFALAREAFLAGQGEFAVHAFPFRMTEANLARHAGSEWEGFWRNLKEGHDRFERSKRPPVVGVAEGRYVFFDDARAVPAAWRAGEAAGGKAQPRLITGWRAAGVH